MNTVHHPIVPIVPQTPDYASLVQSDRVHTSLYTDAAIFAAEMEQVFANTWVWVGHESEIPDTGSYKTAFVGQQPVIMVRDRKQNVHVLLNRCRHRAATVCEHKKGKTNSFVCPYHGWSYALDGTLRGVPHPESYAELLEKDQLPLVSLRVASYQGMVFATFNDDIASLSDFLGPAKKWMDLFMK
nr:Rieske (2Fe-2S) protein [Neisseriaceae bacterium]